MTTSLSSSAKILAWFAIVNGIFTLVSPIVLPLLVYWPLPVSAFVIWPLLGMGSAVSGYYGLREKPWAFWLLFWVFLVQSVEYLSQNFFFSFIGPFAIKFGWGWVSPPSRFNLNAVAIAVCFFAARSATRLSVPASNPSEIP